MNSKDKRINRIIELLESGEKIPIVSLEKIFNICKMTVYRDLKELENIKNIIITKKNIYISKNEIEIPHILRNEINKEEKELIAKRAFKLLKNNETIFLDGSTTILRLAQIIANSSDLIITVFTSSLVITNILSKNNFNEIHLIGGRLIRTNYELYSDYYKEALKNINLNQCFISCSGFSIEKGLSEVIKQEAEFKQYIVDKCNIVNLLVDYSKYNIISTYSYSSIDKVNRLITDKKISQEAIKKLKDKNINTIVES